MSEPTSAATESRVVTPIYVVTKQENAGEKTIYEGTSRRSARIFKSRTPGSRSYRYFTTEREAFDV